IVVRRGGMGGTVSADYSTTDSSAVAGTHYVAAAGTVTLGPGVIATNFQITILDDLGLTNAVPSVEFELNLGNFVNASPGAFPGASVHIFDDETFAEPAGSLDTTFNPDAGPEDRVNALAIEPDGQLLAAGNFRTMNRVFRSRIARLEADGALDGDFGNSAGPNGPLNAIALQPDGRIVIGGMFSQVGATNRSHIARLLPDGTLDATFNPGAGADNPVFALGLLSDGGVVVGGSFASINGISRPGIAVLNPNGTVRTSFDPGVGVNGDVLAIAVQPDDRILIGGTFTTVRGADRARVARLWPDGRLDEDFNPGSGANDDVMALALQPDGRILVGGSFTQFDGQIRGRLARLEHDGSLDTDFLSASDGADAQVNALAVQFDGKILVAGEFTSFNEVARNRLTRLNEDGTTDPTINFGSGANDAILAMIVQPDRKIVIGGRFTAVDGQPRRYLARLHGGSISGAGFLQFSAPYYEVPESGGVLEVEVRRRGGTTGAVSVDYASVAGSAVAGDDFTAVAGTLVFAEGEVVKTFDLPLVNDGVGEPDETLTVTLSTNLASGGATLGEIPNATVIILNDDSSVGFSAASYTVSEGVPGGNLTVAVVRSGATGEVVRVNYFSTNGTARAGADYTAVSGLLTFAPGQTTQTFNVPILNDALIEPSEGFSLGLTNLVGGIALGISNATVTIVDNDFEPGHLSFGATSYSVAEGAGSVTVTVV
ncbi:MAG TPA: Calx-beta domain-containing protein, partial [Methylomirabilota bacterium]|nr:Calx-beta domain-containing protein [Methylomirabilota bacterium]